MNIKEIKKEAKELTKTNKWNIWKPSLVVALIVFCGCFIIGLIAGILGADVEIIGDLTGSLVGFVLIPISVGLYAYYLKIVRKEEFNLSLLTKYYPDFFKLLVMSLIIEVCTILWSLLFIIPGIIAAISYSMAFYICVDKPTLGPNETVKESKRITYGYKMDYFIFKLSFLGWILLIPFTLGIILIWLYPYMTIADAIFYERLKEASEKK